MRVLHLFSDWKWTGPSEPTLDLCAELRARGHDVRLACPPAEETNNRTLPGEARRAGVPLTEPIRFRKNLRLISNLKDARAVAKLIDEHRFDLVHTHQSMDHLVGAAALRFSKRKPPLVRTNHRPRALSESLGGRTLLGGLAGLFSFSQGFHELDRPIVESKGGLAFRIDPALRLDRYPAEVESRRAELGFAPEHFVVGMVMRVQKHRRVDVALEALRLAHRSFDRLRALIVGRGTHRETLAVRPVQRMGLADVIKFSGYVREGYLETLAAFDALLFLRPGSDGTARALREALVLGRPAVVSDFGMLPEIVREGRTGFVVPLDPKAISEKLVELARRPDRAREMGAAARKDARDRFDLKKQAAAVEKAYEQIAGR